MHKKWPQHVRHAHLTAYTRQRLLKLSFLNGIKKLCCSKVCTRSIKFMWVVHTVFVGIYIGDVLHISSRTNEFHLICIIVMLSFVYILCYCIYFCCFIRRNIHVIAPVWFPDSVYLNLDTFFYDEVFSLKPSPVRFERKIASFDYMKNINTNGTIF